MPWTLARISVLRGTGACCALDATLEAGLQYRHRDLREMWGQGEAWGGQLFRGVALLEKGCLYFQY